MLIAQHDIRNDGAIGSKKWSGQDVYGTVLFFDRERTTAYIWPDGIDVSLVALRKTMFPDLWRCLEIGSQLRFATRKADIVTDVALVYEVDGAPVGPREVQPPRPTASYAEARTSSAF
ncbi:MAG: hypothetical protein CML02_19675 [Pseudooceanicola sp.]|jgi:hypothetical protein|nr:hypothetical protein [Pseudooceanicola sp.]|tara:strand:+ start:401 stop:754 length:354 start_codon:yes stop_codon:yes gene_type:complete